MLFMDCATCHNLGFAAWMSWIVHLSTLGRDGLRAEVEKHQSGVVIYGDVRALPPNPRTATPRNSGDAMPDNAYSRKCFGISRWSSSPSESYRPLDRFGRLREFRRINLSAAGCDKLGLRTARSH